MEAGTIVSWEKKEGDKLNEGDYDYIIIFAEFTEKKIKIIKIFKIYLLRR